MLSLAAAVVLAAGAVREVPAGAPLGPVLAAASAGDVIRLGPGRHGGALGIVGAGVELRIEGAGAGVTRVVAPDGGDGVVVRGRVTLTGLSLEAGPSRSALKVLGGEATLEDVALTGGACGAFVDGGRVRGHRVTLGGQYGLLLQDGDAVLDEADVQARFAGVALLAGTVTLRRSSITGPSQQAGVSIARGAAYLEAVVVRAPGPTGLAVSHGGTIAGRAVIVTGAVEDRGRLGGCAEVLNGKLRLDDATLVGCAGAAVEASGGDLQLRALDATGGAAGCLVLVNGAAAWLEGNVCRGRGPGLVVAGDSRAGLVANRWLTDPPAAVDCAGGARVEVGRGEALGPPCGGVP